MQIMQQNSSLQNKNDQGKPIDVAAGLSKSGLTEELYYEKLMKFEQMHLQEHMKKMRKSVDMINLSQFANESKQLRAKAE